MQHSTILVHTGGRTQGTINDSIFIISIHANKGWKGETSCMYNLITCLHDVLHTPWGDINTIIYLSIQPDLQPSTCGVDLVAQGLNMSRPVMALGGGPDSVWLNKQGFFSAQILKRVTRCPLGLWVGSDSTALCDQPVVTGQRSDSVIS